MNNVINVNFQRRKSYQSASIEELQRDVAEILTSRNNTDGEDAAHSLMIEDLHSLTDDHMLKKLKIIHEREAAERSWTVQEAEIAAEMEAAAFLAYRAGVPEEAIYDIDYTPLSDALNRAIAKVQSA